MTVQQTADAAIAATAISTPLWLDVLEKGSAIYIITAGCVLVTVRVAIAVREWRRK